MLTWDPGRPFPVKHGQKRIGTFRFVDVVYSDSPGSDRVKILLERVEA